MNSFRFKGLRISGERKKGDVPAGIVKTWLIPRQKLKLYFKINPSVLLSKYEQNRTQVLLNRYTYTYTWINSTISGYGCLVNNGTTEVNTTMYIFTNETDISDFVRGKGVKNVVLNESIALPPDRQVHCFTEWSQTSPLTVNTSAYYYIGVDVPPHSTYYSNVTITQSYVNTSDYGAPRYVAVNNSTYYDLATLSEFDEDYFAVCEGPSNNEQQTPGLDAESLHIQTCNIPKPALVHYTAIVGSLATITVLLILVLVVGLVTYRCLRHGQTNMLACSCIRNNYQQL